MLRRALLLFAGGCRPLRIASGSSSSNCAASLCASEAADFAPDTPGRLALVETASQETAISSWFKRWLPGDDKSLGAWVFSSRRPYRIPSIRGPVSLRDVHLLFVLVQRCQPVVAYRRGMHARIIDSVDRIGDTTERLFLRPVEHSLL